MENNETSVVVVIFLDKTRHSAPMPWSYVARIKRFAEADGIDWISQTVHLRRRLFEFLPRAHHLRAIGVVAVFRRTANRAASIDDQHTFTVSDRLRRFIKTESDVW